MTTHARRLLNSGAALLALANVALWLAAKHYWVAAMFCAGALAWIVRTIFDWSAPLSPSAEITANPLRAQLVVGAVLLAGVGAWWFWGR